MIIGKPRKKDEKANIFGLLKFDFNTEIMV